MAYVFKEHERPKRWRDYRVRVRYRLALPFFFTEWLAQWAAYLLGKWSLLEVLEYSGSISLVIGVIFYFAGAKDRREQKHYQAWQVINLAQGKGGSGGRLDALQELYADSVPLVGVDVADAYLEGLELPNADLRRSNMSGADLRNAKLPGVNFTDAGFVFTNLRGADLHDADLETARLVDADLRGANLRGVQLRDTALDRADLRDADLGNLIDWQLIRSIDCANILNVKNAPRGFADWARQHGAMEFSDDHEWNMAIKARTAAEEAATAAPTIFPAVPSTSASLAATTAPSSTRK